MPVVRITGLRETQSRLRATVIKMLAIRNVGVKKFAEQIGFVAKENTPIDTGALRDSIHNTTIKSTPTFMQERIMAGKRTVVRGEGKYVMSKKTGRPVSGKTSTDTYAGVVEDREKFMLTAFHWGKANILRHFNRLVKSAIRNI